MNLFSKKNKTEYQIRPENDIEMKLELSEEKTHEPSQIDTSINASEENVLIELHELKKVFGHKSFSNKQNKKQVVAVNGISFKIYTGQNIALLGANGAGKTTTVEIVAGINTPTSGKISYKFEYKDSFHEGVGIQFQDSSYPVGIHVKDVVDFIVNVYSIDLNPAELDKMVEAFGLKEMYKKSARSLSGGQQQRLNILLALIHKPKLVFLDELSTGLDISVKTKIVGFVKEFCKKFNITIVLISHNMEEIENICDRVIIMQKGSIKVDMLSKDIVAKWKTVEELAIKYI